jgi:hypothetical protein
MKQCNIGLFTSILLRSTLIHQINPPGRKNTQRGFKKLRVWNKLLSPFMYRLAGYLKVAADSTDTADSFSRNISKNCRRSLKEYLNHLVIKSPSFALYGSPATGSRDEPGSDAIKSVRFTIDIHLSRGGEIRFGGLIFRSSPRSRLRAHLVFPLQATGGRNRRRTSNRRSKRRSFERSLPLDAPTP